MNALVKHNGFVYADSQEAINDVVCSVIDESQREYIVDRRREYRQPIAILISVAPIENGKLGTEFPAVTHDISAGGISFLHNGPLGSKYLLLRFPEYNREALILEVLRQTAIGPFRMIAGRFRTAF